VTGPEVQERPAPYAEHELGGDLFAGDEQGRFRWQRRLSGVLRERRWLRRLLQLLAVMAFLAGALVFAFPFITNIGADRRQGQLQREFAEPATRSAYVSNSIGRGHALTRIQIPKLGVDSIVVEGTSLKDLEAGAGHYEGTALPCERGNAAIAGHRTTYSKPFARIDDLRAGDQIVLITPVGRCWYSVVQGPWVTAPDDAGVVGKLGGSYLTLTTCHPPGSAAERLVVRARLVFSEPRGA